MEMDDRLSATSVEFQVDQTGKVWLNVDGKCVVRIGKADQVVIELPGRKPQTILFAEMG